MLNTVLAILDVNMLNTMLATLDVNKQFNLKLLCAGACLLRACVWCGVVWCGVV